MDDMTQKSFIRHEVARLIGFKPSKINQYSSSGLVPPDIEDSEGPGTRRKYSKRNLLEMLLAERLIQSGVSAKETKKHLEQLREQSVGQGWILWRNAFFIDDAKWNMMYSVFIFIVDGEAFLYFMEKGKRASIDIRTVNRALIVNITDLVEKVAKL